ncbi:DUF1419 domain-containing protein [Citrobacter portucalensis]|uniref:DUF1419 domain-containing protein n=1 Tax=Citrobacter portucalensis TaxID=1639133 RepID=A0A5B0SUJ5_9ENTR|nr:DUF1419 domain-containing protein [Citrobacter portucalensis]KAA1140404.1 DUF1419 domain-containing protein [Citrobacter portucalensis]
MTTPDTTSNITRPELYFYIPGNCHPQDVAIIPAGSVYDEATPAADIYRGLYSGKTLEEFKSEHPSILLLTWEEVEQRAIDAAKLPVSEISEEKYAEMLEVLPPMNYFTKGVTASFMLMEMYSGNVTDIFARITVATNELRYFRLRDLCTLKHDEIVERCNAFMQK